MWYQPNQNKDVKEIYLVESIPKVISAIFNEVFLLH